MMIHTSLQNSICVEQIYIKMRTQNHSLALLLLCFFISTSQIYVEAKGRHTNIRKSSFPKGFLFGSAGAAYQYEGGAKDGGRGPSIWDTFSHTPGKIDEGDNGDIAADSYHRYKEDIQLLKDMGMDSYRFSISWSRVLPKGTIEGGINQEGINYYNNLINEMINKGIKPFATLFHWDLPQALEDKYKGFLNESIVKDFGEYTELCYKEFGDRVKNWITLNEPWTFASVGYDSGVHAPGHCSKHIGNCTEGNSATEPYIVAHNLILAHANAVKIYRTNHQKAQNGTIGITINGHWMVPHSNKMKDRRAAARALDFMYGWFMNPITKGSYPITMRNIVGHRLPSFTKEEAKFVKGSYDFIGVNYYTARYASHVHQRLSVSETDYNQDSQANLTTERNGVPIGERAASEWLYVYPQGLRDLLLYTKKKYGNPTIYITENGVDEFNTKGMQLKEALNDDLRVSYYLQHLDAVRQAIKKGADVRGYFAWSLLDNFEWNNGYTVRFGLYYVDFNNGTLARYPKQSVHWFKRFLSA